MTLKNFLFTSESVSEGHPDKVCDQLSDAILDAYLSHDPISKVAVESMVTTNRVILAGEVRSTAPIHQDNLEMICRDVVRDIGYEQPGFHWQNFDFSCFVHEQSPDIAAGVDREEGAGDQGIMFGYACNETDAYMPAAIYYAHLLLRRIAEGRKQGKLDGLEPDAKSQVTLEYVNGLPQRATSIVLSSQHHKDLGLDEVRQMIRPYIEETLPQGWMCPDKDLLINPAGRFVVGGPDGDTGLTGRKIIVDTYGGAAPHGGGAFSGKDASKVDRSAAYAARYLAKNVVASGLADKCLIQLSYAIGVKQPLSFYVNCFETGKVDEALLADILPRIMDLSPAGIRQHLHLNRPIFRKTATYGHFGRTPEEDGSFSWEKTDLVDQILVEAKHPGKRLCA